MSSMEELYRPGNILKMLISLVFIALMVEYFGGILFFGAKIEAVQIGNNVVIPLLQPNRPNCQVYETTATLKEVQRGGGLLGSSRPEFWFVFGDLTHQEYDMQVVLTHTPERLYRVEVCGTWVASFKPVEGK